MSAGLHVTGRWPVQRIGKGQHARVDAVMADLCSRRNSEPRGTNCVTMHRLGGCVQAPMNNTCERTISTESRVGSFSCTEPEAPYVRRPMISHSDAHNDSYHVGMLHALHDGDLLPELLHQAKDEIRA